MGGSGSKPANLSIWLDKPCYNAGDTLSGKVYLLVTQPDYFADTLQVSLSGREATRIRYTTGSGKKKKRRTARAQRNIMVVDLPLHQFPDSKCTPGQFEFPFSLVLPETLPTSMFVDDGLSGCQVFYEISARLNRPGWTTWDVTARQPFNVSQIPRALMPSAVFCEPAIIPVNSCFCCYNGSMAIGASLDSGMVTRGGVVNVMFACKNDSVAVGESMQVNVSEVCSWNAGTRRRSFTRLLTQRLFNPSDIPGCRPAPTVGPTIDDQVSAKMCRDIFDQLKTGAGFQAALQLPVDTRDSYSGGLIKVNHIVQVLLMTDCCITDPESATNIFVQNVVDPQRQSAVPLPADSPLPPELKQTTPGLPPDWTAVTQEEVRLDTSTAILGGVEQDGGDADDDPPPAYFDPPPSYEESTVDEPPPLDLSQLHKELQATLNDLGVLQRYVKMAPKSTVLSAGLVSDLESLYTAGASNKMLASLQADQFATLVGIINFPLDRPVVAKILAHQIGPNFTCAHVVAALPFCGQLEKPQLLRFVVPLCVDLAQKGGFLCQHLTVFENMIVEDLFKGTSTDTRQCSQCKHAYDAEAQFCTECGSRTTEVVAVPKYSLQ